LKGVVGVTVMMWVRWTLPRLRIDQVITTCLKYCVPIAAVGFLGATLWQYRYPDGLIIPTAQSAYRVSELWPSATAAKPQAEPPSDRSAGDGAARDTVRPGRGAS
jgi:hypothetical protein